LSCCLESLIQPCERLQNRSSRKNSIDPFCKHTRSLGCFAGRWDGRRRYSSVPHVDSLANIFLLQFTVLLVLLFVLFLSCALFSELTHFQTVPEFLAFHFSGHNARTHTATDTQTQTHRQTHRQTHKQTHTERERERGSQSSDCQSGLRVRVRWDRGFF
jgi:hypothetical protein